MTKLHAMWLILLCGSTQHARHGPILSQSQAHQLQE
jgi:hypothetical protein